MNKDKVVDEISRRLNLSKKDIRDVVDTFIDVITESMVKFVPVKIVGFGTFLVRTRAARKGRNPQTGETIHLSESRTPSFSPSKGLKSILRGG